MRDYYAVLGVSATASTGAIRTAYRRLALTLHPDRAGQASTEAFRQVALAYEVLSDPQRRQKYDAHRATPAAAPAERGRAKDRLERVSGPLRSLLAAGLLRTIGEEAYELWLTADEATSGGYISITTSAPKQFLHWITVPAGVADKTVLPSVIRVEGHQSVIRLQIRRLG